MAGPNEQTLVVSRSNQGQTHERRLLQIEFLLALAPQVIFFQLAAVKTPPILALETHLHGSPDDLQRFLDAFPRKAGSEYRVCVDRCLPRFFEHVFVETSLQLADYLGRVDAAVRSVEGVEEHAFLHRREGIKIFDWSGGFLDLGQLPFVQMS